MENAKDSEMVTIFCYGGCGRSIQLPKALIHDDDVVCCSDGFGDTRFFRLLPGKVRTFWEHKYQGVTFRIIQDIWPDAETIREIQEAQECWAYTVAEIAMEDAIKKAKERT